MSRISQLKKKTERKAKARNMRAAGVHKGREQVRKSTAIEILNRFNVMTAKKTSKEDFIEMINHTLMCSAGISSILEVLTMLESEEPGKYITEGLKSKIDEFDAKSIRFAENAEICMSVLSTEKGRMEDIPMELILDTGFTAQDIAQKAHYEIMADVPKEVQVKVDEYVKEHSAGLPQQTIMIRLALTRIDRIRPKYATPAVAEAEAVNEEVEPLSKETEEIK